MHCAYVFSTMSEEMCTLVCSHIILDMLLMIYSRYLGFKFKAKNDQENIFIWNSAYDYSSCAGSGDRAEPDHGTIAAGSQAILICLLLWIFHEDEIDNSVLQIAIRVTIYNLIKSANILRSEAVRS